MSLSAPSRTANAVDDAHQLTPSSLGESFATQIETATRKAGLTFAVSSAREDEKHFGNALVTGRLGPFGASFVRDHGQIFLELGPADAPGPAHYRSFQDIQLFLRWTSMDELLAREGRLSIRRSLGLLDQLLEPSCDACQSQFRPESTSVLPSRLPVLE